MGAGQLIIQKMKLWISKYYTLIHKYISNYITIIFVIWVCFSACTGRYLQETQTVDAQETNQEITSAKETSTQSITDITTLHPTVSPEALATETMDVNELIPGFRPEAWMVFPISELGINPPNDAFPYFSINDIAEDKNGTMWFATTHGLMSFDGITWQLVSNDKKMILTTYVEYAKDGSIWFTMSDGIYRYYSGSFNPEMYLGEYGGHDIYSMSISNDGEVWVALKDGIHVFYEDEWHSLSDVLPFPQILSNVVFTDIVVDNEGGVYLSWGSDPYIGGIAHFYQDKWEVFNRDDIEAKNGSDGSPFYADYKIIDDNGHVWFYEWRTGLYEYYDGEFTLHAAYTDKIWAYQPDSLVADDRGNIWLGAWNEVIPISIYVPGTDQIQSIDGSSEFGSTYPPHSRYRQEGIIPFKQVSALYIDSKNQLWIATELGIYVLDLESGFPVTPSS